MNRTFIIYY